MKRITPIGKKNFVGKKFKKAGPNELNASDKNFVRNNINLFNTSQLAFKVGKPVAVIEKFIKKEKLVSTFEVREIEVFEESIVSVEVLPSKHDKVESSKAKKVTDIKETEIIAKKVDFIRENHLKYSVTEMATMLNASVNGVRYHLKNLDKVKVPYKTVKTPPEVILERKKFIQENYQKHTVCELSEKLNCSQDIVRITLRKLELTALRVPDGKEISPQAINFIKVNYRTMTAHEMSEALGNVSWTQIKYLCEKHGFLKTPEEITAIRNRWNRSEFTVSEEKYIIMNHGNIPLSEIADNLKRTRSSVVKLLSRKGLKITKEQHDILNKKNFEKGRIAMRVILDAKKMTE